MGQDELSGVRVKPCAATTQFINLSIVARCVVDSECNFGSHALRMLAAQVPVDFQGQHSAVAVTKPAGTRRNINSAFGVKTPVGGRKCVAAGKAVARVGVVQIGSHLSSGAREWIAVAYD